MTRYSSIAVCILAWISSSMAYGMFHGETSRSRELFNYLAPNALRNEEILQKLAYEDSLLQNTRDACEVDAHICNTKPTYRPPPILTIPAQEEEFVSLILTPPNPTMGGSPAILEDLLGIAPPAVPKERSVGGSPAILEDLLGIAPPLERREEDVVDALMDNMMTFVLNFAMSPPSMDVTPPSDAIITNMDAAEEVFDTFLISILSHSAAAEEAIASSDDPEEAITDPSSVLYNPAALTQKIREKGQDVLEQAQQESESSDHEEEYYDEYYNLKQNLARRLTQVDAASSPQHRRLQAIPEEGTDIIIFSFIEQPQPSPPHPIHYYDIGFEPFVEECLWHKHAFETLSSSLCFEYLDTVKDYLEHGRDVVVFPSSSYEGLSMKERFLSIFGLVYGFFSLTQRACGEEDDSVEQEEEEEDCASCLTSVVFNLLLVALCVFYFAMCVIYTNVNSMAMMGIPALFVGWSICGCLESCFCAEDEDEKDQNEDEEVYLLIPNDYPGAMAMEERNRGNKEAYEGVPVSMSIQIV
mmetsp:Transcript_36146/g.55209  ORF Transcript_36146/g.55209 Transcript_36146/m.55209 type:complete len:527 (+) Transcript_36146:103-1683(+)